MNLQYLNDKITLSRIPITAIAEGLEISRQSLYNKIKGEREFKASEVTKICELLRLTEDEKRLVFFADAVDKNANQEPTASQPAQNKEGENV